jgi:hypothetical protein
VSKSNRKTRGTELFSPALALGFLAIAALPASAATVFSRGGLADAYSPRTSYLISWTQTSGYSSASITADVCSNTGLTATATAYLTNSIGTGTTVANQIATAPISTTVACFSGTPVTIFTGLTLPPGTYYLVISNQSGNFEWNFDFGGAIEADGTGVTGNPDEASVATPPAYPPSDPTFSSFFGGNRLQFSVTGSFGLPPSAPTATPTLSTWGMIGLGGALLLFGMKAAGRHSAA